MSAEQGALEARFVTWGMASGYILAKTCFDTPSRALTFNIWVKYAWLLCSSCGTWWWDLIIRMKCTSQWKGCVCPLFPLLSAEYLVMESNIRTGFERQSHLPAIKTLQMRQMRNKKYYLGLGSKTDIEPICFIFQALMLVNDSLQKLWVI